MKVGSNREMGRGPMGGWEYVKAITSLYDGIGGNRVSVDYERFVIMSILRSCGRSGMM